MDGNDFAQAKLVAGIEAERSGDFHRAVREYREGLRHPNEDFDIAYFLNNNLGYSLNQIGEFVEAGQYCRRAIGIDRNRYNAHKNLGLALQGQGRHVDAALSLQLASLLSSDPRAQQHLDELLAEHPEVRDSLQSYIVVEGKHHAIVGQSGMIH